MRDYIDALEAMSHKQLVLLLARQRRAATEGIAVVGMACRFPGGLDTPARLWSALREGRVVYGDGRLPEDSLGRPRWNLAAPDIAPFADLLRRGAYLDRADLFDAERFGIGDDEAAHLDPQQRWMLTCAAEALADAGLADAAPDRLTAVFGAVSTIEYSYAALRNGVPASEISAYMGTGGAFSAAPSRIAQVLRLNGPAIAVDTACSSALTAVHLAGMALRAGECDVAVVGASHLLLSPATFGVFERSGQLSPTGRVRPFDAKADGYVRGEGCGVLVLVRERDARDAYAVIRGSAVHQQGGRVAMSAASAVSQAKVIREALLDADVAPEAVPYVEAQANGVRLATVVELEVLGQEYGRARPGAAPLHLGSAKANLGYLETVSGMAGLMKAVLAVRHGEIPGQVGLDDPDPAVPWDRLALRVPRDTTPWPDGARRLAGVSSFGFTGMCGHAVLEAASGERPDRTVASAPGRRHWPESHVWS